MQRALRPYATAGVAMLSASLIIPIAAPQSAHRAVALAAGESLSDLAGFINAGLTAFAGAGEPAADSITDALTFDGGALSAEASGVLPNLGDAGANFADASSQTTLQLLDPAFWQLFWYDLLDPDAGSAAWLLLTGATEELPVIGPLLGGFGLFFVFPAALLVGYLWSQISEIFDIPSSPAAADAVSDLLDPSSLTSALDPTGLIDVATALGAGEIPDLGGILAGLLP